jgi:soluble lytic murein transglycosylase
MGLHDAGFVQRAILTLFFAAALSPSNGQAQQRVDVVNVAVGAQISPSIACEDGPCARAHEAMRSGAYDEAARQFLLEAYQPRAGSIVSRRTDWIIQAAFAQGRAKNHDEAARLFWQAARELPELRDFFYIRAAQHMLDGVPSQPMIEEIKGSGALDRGYAGAALVRARLDAHVHSGLPQLATLKTALESDERESTCRWLLGTLSTRLATGHAGAIDPTHLATLGRQAYGACFEDEFNEPLSKLGVAPDATARLTRADHYFYQVRYQDTQRELDALNLRSLDVTMRCRALFRQGRTHFRTRNWAAANEEFKKVVDQCAADPASESVHVRSLYAVGRYAHDRNALDEAESVFTLLLNTYPQRSHADDALFYLARVARKRGQRSRELELLDRALKAYPHEDMIHEMAWEVHESLFRGGQFKEFIDAVKDLPLPAYDNQYFSQGRLEYFLASAYDRTEQRREAIALWQNNWQKYPFSFYGYLSNLRLRERGQAPASLDGGDLARQADWFDETWQQRGSARLVRLNLFEEACDYETAYLSRTQTTTTDRWRQATLCHLAGRFPVSHDIARRQIPGSPWAEPVAGRLVRWQVAFPDPFGPRVREAVDAERPQWRGAEVHPALASAIMREESAFIPENVSWAGAIGLMQLMPATALGHDNDIEGRATPDRLIDPAINIRVAIDHIFSLANRFDSHPVLMTAAYNAGSGRVNQWLKRFPNQEIALFVENIPFLETRDYTKRVIGSYGAYQWLSGQHELDERVRRPAR